MATEQRLYTISVPASADISTKQYYAVVFTSGKIAVAGAGVKIDGILQDKPAAADRPGSVGILGGSKAVAGAAVTIGDRLMTDSSGKVITATGTNITCGKALSAAGADDDVIDIVVETAGSHLAIA